MSEITESADNEIEEEDNPNEPSEYHFLTNSATDDKKTESDQQEKTYSKEDELETD